MERDDRERCHTCPNQGQCRLSASETGVEETETWHHDQDHGRSHDDVCLVTGLEPLVQVLSCCEAMKSASVLHNQQSKTQQRPIASTRPIGRRKRLRVCRKLVRIIPRGRSFEQIAHVRNHMQHAGAKTLDLAEKENHLLESPPVAALVPLKGVGGPIHE